MDRAADAEVGLRAYHHELADAQPAEDLFQQRAFERIAVALLDDWLGRPRFEFGDDLPFGRPANEALVVVLHPDDRRPLIAGAFDEFGDVRDDGIALMRTRHDAGLDVDDKQGGVGPVWQRGHGVPSVRATG